MLNEDDTVESGCPMSRTQGQGGISKYLFGAHLGPDRVLDGDLCACLDLSHASGNLRLHSDDARPPEVRNGGSIYIGGSSRRDVRPRVFT